MQSGLNLGRCSTTKPKAASTRRKELLGYFTCPRPRTPSAGVAGGYRKQVEVSGVHPRFSSYWKREASDGELHAGHGDRGGHPAASS
jgi:hypothetical protein